MRSEVIAGLEKMQKRLASQDFIAIPTGPFLRDWRETFKEEAIRLAPVWRGDIAQGIESAQDTKRFPLWARVFTYVAHARWADLGTGILSEDPLSSKQRYFPSISGIREWAEDHGMDPYALAMSIWRQGGTPPTRFFQKAAEKANSLMDARTARWASDVERQAGIVP